MFEHLADHRAEFSEAPVRLNAGELRPGGDLSGDEVYRRLERVLALAHESVGGSRRFVALLPAANDVLGRLAQRELREGRFSVEPPRVAQDLERPPHFLVAELIEWMVRRGRGDGGRHEKTESQAEGRLAHGCSLEIPDDEIWSVAAPEDRSPSLLVAVQEGAVGGTLSSQ